MVKIPQTKVSLQITCKIRKKEQGKVMQGRFLEEVNKEIRQDPI